MASSPGTLPTCGKLERYAISFFIFSRAHTDVVRRDDLVTHAVVSDRYGAVSIRVVGVVQFTTESVPASFGI
jgi:hypothetical protein